MNTSTEKEMAKKLTRFSYLEEVLIQEYINISRYEVWLVQAHLMFAFKRFHFYIPFPKRKPRVRTKNVSPFDRAKNNLDKYFSYPLSSKFVHNLKKDVKKETISESSWHRVVRGEKQDTKIQSSIPDLGHLGTLVVHAVNFISEKDQFEKNIQMKHRKTAMLILMERYSGYMQAVMLRPEDSSIKAGDLISCIKSIKKRFEKVSLPIQSVTFISTDLEKAETSTACHKTIDQLGALLQEHDIIDGQKVKFQKELVFDRKNVIDFKRSSFLKDQFLELKKKYKKKFGSFSDLKSVFQMQETLLKSGGAIELQLILEKYCLKSVKKKNAGKGNTVPIEDIVKNSTKAIILEKTKEKNGGGKNKDDKKDKSLNLKSYLNKQLNKYNLGNPKNFALPLYILWKSYKEKIPASQRMEFSEFKRRLNTNWNRKN
jgi:hypothetical protein